MRRGTTQVTMFEITMIPLCHIVLICNDENTLNLRLRFKMKTVFSNMKPHCEIITNSLIIKPLEPEIASEYIIKRLITDCENQLSHKYGMK